MEFIYKQESYDIVGALFEVYNEKGPGFVEPVYHECLELEFNLRSTPFTSESPLPLFYKGTPLKQKYRPDFVCYDKIILELKAVKTLTNEHRAQVLNYLKATGFKLGILANFSDPEELKYERILL